MDMNTHFPNTLIAFIQSQTPDTFLEKSTIGFPILWIRGQNLGFHCISIKENEHTYQQGDFQKLTQYYQEQHVQLIHVWEDLWIQKQAVIESMIVSLLGKTTRLHARETETKRIDKPTLNQFIAANHLSVPTAAKFKYGLYHQQGLVAVASFGPMRQINRNGKMYRSGELIRFCNRKGMTVVGGFSKLLKAFVRDRKPDDLMTYVSRDWASGKSYLKLGFQLRAETVPMKFWVHPQEMIRYPEKRLLAQLAFNSQEVSAQEFLLLEGYIEIFDSGNLKFVKLLN